jgi:hypothetical protein
VELDNEARSLYKIRFFVWELWKGMKAIEIEVLGAQSEASCFEYPPLRVGETISFLLILFLRIIFHLVYREFLVTVTSRPVLVALLADRTLTAATECGKCSPSIESSNAPSAPGFQ